MYCPKGKHMNNEPYAARWVGWLIAILIGMLLWLVLAIIVLKLRG